MKKTLFALLLLGCVAQAEEINTMLTTGISVTKAGVTTTMSAILDDYSDMITQGTANEANVGWNRSYLPAGNTGKKFDDGSISFTVTLNGLYNADTIHPKASITLNSLSYLVNSNGWCQDGQRSMTVTVNGTGQSVSGNLETHRSGAWMTLSTSDLVVSMNDTLTVTISTTSSDEGLSLATADIWGLSGASVEWMGVSSEKSDADFNFNTNWSNEAPLVKLSITATPEPATATLSLLALVGLAARRRRH